MRKQTVLNRELPLVTAVNKLIPLALLFWLPVAWAQKVDFAIDQVAIDTNSCGSAAAKQLLFACHRLGRGQGFVVAERRYWAPQKTDDDAFEKLTVYFVSKPKPGYVVDLPSDAVAVFLALARARFRESMAATDKLVRGKSK